MPDETPAGRPTALGGLSLRSRLTAVAVATLALSLLIGGLATLAVLRLEMIGRLDFDLRQASQPQALERLVRRDRRPPGEAELPTPYDITFLSQDGRELQHWPSGQADGRPEMGYVQARLAARGTDRAFTVDSEAQGDDLRWRVVARSLQLRTPTGEATPIMAVIATPLDGLEQTLVDTGVKLLATGLLVMLLCGVVAWYAIRHALRPLHEVESVAMGFGAGDTTRRVPARPETTEVGRLGASVNAMLDRIESTLAAREASEARMRRFVADASHELRTPLASVRGFAELYRMGAVSEPQEVGHNFRRIEDEASRMAGLVEDLLVLARLDEQRPVRRDPVDLLVIAGDVVHDAGAREPDRSVTLVGLDGAGPAAAPAIGDDARLRQVLVNLVANALRHTTSSVEVAVGVSDGWARWRVIDHGPGIPAQDRQKVFERFYRSDSSRQRGRGGGAGLGLAIVSAIVAAHKGMARVVQTPGGGATFEVAIPHRDEPS